jgi:hypothetical protein
MALHDMQVPPKSAELHGMVHSGTSLKDSGQMKSFQWAETLSSVPYFSFFLETKMARCVIVLQYMGCGQWFCWMVKDLEET